MLTTASLTTGMRASGINSTIWRNGRTSKLIEIGVGIAGTPHGAGCKPSLDAVSGRSPGRAVLRHRDVGEPGRRRGRARNADVYRYDLEHIPGGARHGAGGRGGMERLRGRVAGRDVSAERVANRDGPDVAAAGNASPNGIAAGKRSKADLLAAAAADITKRINDTPNWKRGIGKVIQRLTGSGGANANLASLTEGLPGIPALNPAQIRTQNIAADWPSEALPCSYPAANVYCEKIVNSQAEKFRTFSGTIQMAIDLRHSTDRVDKLQATWKLTPTR